jgi:hypothetical protein
MTHIVNEELEKIRWKNLEKSSKSPKKRRPVDKWVREL